MSALGRNRARAKAVWKTVRIGDTLRLVNGSAFKPSDWTAEGTPIVRIQNLNNPEAAFNRTTRQLPEKFKLRGGELLFAWSGTPGTSFGAHIWRGGEAWLNQHIFNVLFDENEWDKKFLQFAINQNLDEYIRAAHGGAGLAHITKGRFEESELLQPPLLEQRRIVAEIEKQFTRLEAGVAALRRVQANLKRYRAAVLKAACEGRLVPTEAALRRGRGQKSAVSGQESTSATSAPSAVNPPAFETGEQLLARILAERRKNWTDRGTYKEPAAPDTANLPPLPEGWAWASVDQLAEVGTGATPKRGRPEYYEAGTIPWVTSSSLNRPYVDSADECVTKKALDETNLTVFPVGSLLVAMYGEGKTRGKCSELRIEAATNQAVAGIQCPVEVRGYIKLSLWRQYEAMRQVASGGVQPNLNLSLVRAICIPLSPLAEQQRIVAEVERRLSVVDELEAVVTANLQRASRLRQAILKKAFTGELL